MNRLNSGFAAWVILLYEAGWQRIIVRSLWGNHLWHHAS